MSLSPLDEAPPAQSSRDWLPADTQHSLQLLGSSTDAVSGQPFASSAKSSIQPLTAIEVGHLHGD